MLQPGDIVVASFLQDDGRRKMRPALIVEVALDEKAGLMARLAYGTSQRVSFLAPWEFKIDQGDGSAWTASGLNLPTKFELNVFVWLDVSSCRQIGVISHAIGGRMMAAARAARAKGYL